MNKSVEFYKQYIGQRISAMPSALGNWLNGKVLKVEEDSLSIEFEVKEDMTNPVKMLHGGMMAAMMDEVIGMTIFVNGEKKFFFSIHLNVNFMSNVNVGTPVVVTSQIIKKSPRLIHAECYIHGPENKLLASGSASLVSVEAS